MNECSLAWSIQVYQFNTSKTVSAIERICNNAIQIKTYPQILKKVENNGDYVLRKLKIQKGDVFYEFVIKPSSNLLILGGRGSGRNDVNDYLSDLIEKESSGYFI